MELGQVGQLVLLAPEAQLVLRLGGRRAACSRRTTYSSRALGSAIDLEDLRLLEAQGRLARLGQDRDAVGAAAGRGATLPRIWPPPRSAIRSARPRRRRRATMQDDAEPDQDRRRPTEARRQRSSAMRPDLRSRSRGRGSGRHPFELAHCTWPGSRLAIAGPARRHLVTGQSADEAIGRRS